MKLDFKEFFRDADKHPHRFFYLCGVQDYLKQRAKDRLCKRPTCAGFSKVLLDGKDFDKESLWNSISQQQLFAGGEVIILENWAKATVASKKAMLEILEHWLDADTSAIGDKVVICVAGDDQPDPGDPIEGFALANPRCVVTFFPELTMQEALSWAKGELQRKKVPLPEALLAQAAQACANDLYLWANFIDRLELCCAGKTTVDAEVMAELLGPETIPETLSWSRFKDALRQTLLCATAQGAKSMQIRESLGQIFEKGNESPGTLALQALRVMADNVHELALARSGLRAARTTGLDANSLRIGRWDWDRITRCYDAVIDAERHIKTGTLEPVIAVNEAVGRWEDLAGNA
ncbi:MAG: hypothetical protein AABZ44_09820 [Elusimicrobiota bacterium]